MFYPIAKDPDSSNRVKMQQKKLFWNFTVICHNWKDLRSLIFLKSPCWTVWTIWAGDLLKGSSLSCVISMLLKVQLFSKNTSRRLLVSEFLWSRIWDQAHLDSEILVSMKHYKNMFMKQFFKKAHSLFFLTNCSFRTRTLKSPSTSCFNINQFFILIGLVIMSVI